MPDWGRGYFFVVFVSHLDLVDEIVVAVNSSGYVCEAIPLHGHLLVEGLMQVRNFNSYKKKINAIEKKDKTSKYISKTIDK